MTGATPTGIEWRVTCASPEYIVSSLGDVRHGRVNAPLLRGDTDPKGYRRVAINGKHHRVARLVCEAFHGACPPDHECGHLDGNKHNDAAANLAWITRSENTKQSIAHGTYRRPTPPKGEAHPHAKLTSDQVVSIRRLATEGRSERSLAKEFGVSSTQIHRIITKEKWRG